MIPGHLIKRVALSLILLATGIAPVLAEWEYEKIDGEEGGGGTYNFRIENEKFSYSLGSYDPTHLDWFWTQKRFDVTKDQFYFEFEMRVVCDMIINYDKNFLSDLFGSEVQQTLLEGEVYVVTSDDVSHKIGTWTKQKTDANYISFEELDSDYSSLFVTNLNTDNGHITIRMMPGDKAFNEGVKRVIFKNRLVFKDSRQWGWFQYEKDIVLSSLNETQPMPKLSFEWNEEGGVTFTAADMRDVRDNPLFLSQDYRVGRYYYHDGSRTRRYNDFETADENVNLTEKNGNMEMTFSTNDLSSYAYTNPVFVRSRGETKINAEGKGLGWNNWWFIQPYVSGMVEPFTRPESVHVEFDKWSKTNTITWTKREKTQYYDGLTVDFVDCRTDGKWYVIRYDKGKDAKLDGYKLLGSINGTSSELKVSDQDIEYDHDYVYRVVFLPSLIENKCKENLADLPGQGSSHSINDLWEESNASTLMEVPIRLTQDRSYEKAVRLIWEYNVQLSGLKWHIYWRPVGDTSWKVLDETMPIDTKQSTTHFDADGTVCDLIEYQVKATINGKELESNILVGNLPAGSYISEVKATTGTEDGEVIVKWKVARADLSNDSYYRVLRRPIGTEEWTLLDDAIHGKESEYEYRDKRVAAGTYYEYTVEAYGAKCDEQFVQTGSMIAPGFSQARGTISGHIAFGTGTAVSGVHVNLVKSSADESSDTPQYLSRYIDGEGKGLTWKADSAKYASVLNGKNELTLQLWVKPLVEGGEPKQAFLHLANALELGVKRIGETTGGTAPVYYLYAVDLTMGNETERRERGYGNLTFDATDFTHVAARYSGGAWTFAVGKDSLTSDSLTTAAADWNACSQQGAATLSLGGSLHQTGSTFKGYIDDVRIWSRALTTKEIDDNRNRILGGMEKDLVLYWPLDEGIGIRDYAFDVTRRDGLYMENHPEVGANAVPSAVVPEHLKLYGVTDSEGDYIIRGIPFQQDGTNYKVVPAFGVHQFSPNSLSRFVSPTSLTANDVNFEDISSFPMEGYVHYAGTNIPAEGIMLYVDGELQSKDGKAQQTNAEGFYSISVPIGKHYVEARLDSHTMAHGGRFPHEGTYNFEHAMTCDFADSTLVNFVGRVGGGERNDTLAVGFGASKNNIGIATITLKLNNESFSFNCQDDHITPATRERTFESDTTSIDSHAWTGVDNKSKYIYIRTDSLTGEFSAMLPPLKYITKSVRVDKNPDIEFSSLPEIDLTGVMKTLQDSLLIETDGGNQVCRYYKYNTKKVFAHYAIPTLEVWQEGNPRGAFGEKEIAKYPVAPGDTIPIADIYSVGDKGEVNYKYGYPIFQMDEDYTFGIRGYETYLNRDGKTAVADTIPLNDMVVTIANELSDEQAVVGSIQKTDTVVNLRVGQVYDLKSNELQLSDKGIQKWTWTAGAPNTIAPFARNVSASYKRKDRTYVWNDLDGIILGALSQGNNFVTEGPDKPLMVLRDPPGAKSKTTWKTGEVLTEVRTRCTGWTTKDAIVANMGWGIKAEMAAGIGVMLITKNKLTQSVDLKLNYQHEWMNNRTETWTMTTTEGVSTGTDIYHVGSPGDVFIGVSNNLLLSDCNRVGFYRDVDKSIVLDCRVASMVSLKEKTTFFYSAYEIEKVMIPKWKALRNELLTSLPTEDDCKNYVNDTDESVYLTWKQKGDPQFGDSTYVVWKEPKNGSAQDMFSYYNSQVNMWENVLSQNEEDKWIAISNKQDYHKRNISFDGGTGYSYSERRDTSDVTTHSYAGQATLTLNFRTKVCHTAGGTFGLDMGFDTDNGVKWNNVDSDSTENKKNYAEFVYDFNDGNRGTDFSVDIYRSPKNWSNSFSIFGGQSYNPYEGIEYARYFEPELKHVLSNGTQQMEQPDIRISVDGEQSAKTLTVTDIPAGQKKNLVLHLTNNNQTQQPFDMTYNLVVVETSNNNGLQVYMDGVPMNGRSVLIPKNETVLKNITISQTDQSKLKHEGVKIRFASPYQPLSIYDEVTLNATFVPSSSPVDLIIDEPIFNSDSPDSLEMKIANFDRNFTNLKCVGVQYKFEGSTTWSEFCRFDSAYISKNIVPDRGYLRKWIDMRSDVGYPQGTYAFRAFTMTKYGNDDVYAYSDEVTVIKDNISPRALTTPTPANGILGYDDDMSIEFNEDIVPGYVGEKNVIVTSKLNGAPIDHEVSLKMISRGSASRTVNPVFLTGDFTLEFWMKWTEGGMMLCQGVTEQLFLLTIDNDGAVILKMGDTNLKSLVNVPRDTWIYMVLSYKSSDQKVSMLAEWDQKSEMLFEKKTVDFSVFEAMSRTSDNYLYIGRGIVGSIHDLSLYNVYLDVYDAASKKYNSKDKYVYGLLHYWPMNEGHGTVAADMRHINDLMVNDRWEINNVNYSLDLKNANDVYADISRINTSAGESYAIELWCDILAKNEGILFETGRSDLTRLRLRYDSAMNLVLDYGVKSQVVASNEDFPNHGNWHHLAFNVVRGQAASFYYNGKRTAVISEQDVPTFEGSRMKLGTGLSGYIDELRIWHATMTESRLLSNIYQCLDTADVYSRGLVAYYPFEKSDTINGVPTKGPTLKNLAPCAQADTLTIHAEENSFTRISVPPLRNAPEETRLVASPVASERKVVVRLTGAGVTPRDIEGTTLNITVAEIHDMHGNISKPIRWTAYVQQNTLKWEKDSVNVFKAYGADAFFDVDIVNKGGTVEYYTLQNLPQWLTLVGSETADDVAPLSTKTLRFRINPLTPIGDYDLNIGLQGNYEILEPLRLVMKVRGELPDWTIDPTAYEHQMTIIGHVRLNGFIMENSESLVAAFIDGECRGLASPADVRNGAFVTLNVYGDSYEDMDYKKPVTFSIWDAAAGMTYVDVNVSIPGDESGQVFFEHDLLLGNYNEPVVWTKSNKAEQQIPVHMNWNWIALGVEPEDNSPHKVFADYDGWALTIKDHGSQVAWSNGSQWRGPLTVGANTMYKLRVASLPSSPVLPSQLKVTGQQVNLSETPVELYEGWNWIAYTPLYTMTVGEALAGANPAIGDRIKSQTGIAIYDLSGWEGNLTALESGHGYLYYNSTPGYKTFVYPAQTRNDAGARYAPRRMALAYVGDEPTIFTPVDKHLYPDNMTMVVQITDGEATVDTCEVAVFIDGECRAATRAIDGLYYLIIAGEGSNQPMEIVTCLNDRIVLLDNSHVFVSDDNIGDPWSPYVIDLQHLPDGISDINADDYDPDAWYTLQGFRLSGRPELPGIYIHNGQKVAIGRKAADRE